MGLIDLLKGKTPEELELRGDKFYAEGSFGPAKIEYEKARAKHDKKAVSSRDFESRIKDKIIRARESLAEVHYHTAKDLIQADCLPEARELLDLAMDLSEDTGLIAGIEKLLDTVKEKSVEISDSVSDSLSYEESNEDISEAYSRQLDDESYFNVLLSALPEEERLAYETYGEEFAMGYTALNQGDFPRAEACLIRALEEHSGEQTFIPLELATCYLNMGAYGKAKQMLGKFMADFPHSLRAYQVMCEALWSEGSYEEAGDLLYRCPGEISTSPVINMLKGETLVQAGKLKEAEKFYHELIDLNGRDEIVLRSLAGVYEMLGETERAKGVYGELLNACKGCGRRADVQLKQRFADTSFELGERTTGILEIYLELANEDPFNRGEYFARVSEIYSTLGYENEALRFKQFSERELKGRR